MKEFFTTVLLGALSLSFIACSTSDEKAESQPKNTSRRENQDLSANGVNAENRDAAAAAGNSNAVINPIEQIRQKKMDRLRRAAANSPPVKVDIEAMMQRSARPAPENSEFSAVLTDFILERRTFKSHPQLSKVEKVSDGENKSITVFLIDGKVIELSGDKIEFLSTVSTADLLTAAGLETSPAIKKLHPKGEKKSAALN